MDNKEIIILILYLLGAVVSFGWNITLADSKGSLPFFGIAVIFWPVFAFLLLTMLLFLCGFAMLVVRAEPKEKEIMRVRLD